MNMQKQQLWTARRSGEVEVHQPEMFAIRTPYDKDKARVIHSACFRRLQSKTQLFNMHQHDFSRTRLTHSLEVMQIATGITRLLRAKYNVDGKQYEGMNSTLIENPHLDASQEFRELILDYLPSDALIETICLAHDIGHPPYGHSGEYALNRLMYNYGNFEGNAQSLRNVARLENYSRGYGLDLTRRTLLGIIKYPTLISATQPIISADKQQYIDSYSPGKGIYLEDQDIFDWVLEPLSPADKELFTSVTTKTNYLGVTGIITRFKSFDCSIMELADDIAYSIHDLEDAIKFKIVTKEDWDEFFARQNPAVQQAFADIASEKYFGYDFLTEMFGGDATTRKQIFGRLTALFINHVQVYQQGVFSDPIIDLKANIPQYIKYLLFALKNFSREYILSDRDVRGRNNKGQRMIRLIFQDLVIQPTILGRKKYLRYQKLSTDVERMRFICDFIASMTNDAVDAYYNNYIA